jgi:HAD superfamily hydrolase (TIGR01490 family)
MIAAFFDCDGTLYSAQMGWGLLRYAGSHGSRRTLLAYYAAILPRYYLHKLKLVDEERLHRSAISKLAWLVEGWDVERAAAAFQWVADEYLLPTQRPPVIARLRQHQERGHLVALVSGMLAPCLERLGERLGVEHLLGTQLEAKDGIYTGSIIPPVLNGEAKARCLREYLVSQGLEVDWALSHAYADSIQDRGLLRMVGHPAAVHPDTRLLALARDGGWEVLDETG